MTVGQKHFYPRPIRAKGYCRALRYLFVHPSAAYVLLITPAGCFYPLLKQVHVQLDEVTPVAGGWHFIAATAIERPKATCQFAADDILLYECFDIILSNEYLSNQLERKKSRNVSILPQYHMKPLKEEVTTKSHIKWET